METVTIPKEECEKLIIKAEIADDALLKNGFRRLEKE